jgi:hypothetical protein
MLPIPLSLVGRMKAITIIMMASFNRGLFVKESGADAIGCRIINICVGIL